ncbi:MAG: CopG family transcriptional regulator [Chloroflexi bacterium]|nr:CopG family transcriptional regulator [Chloroflexota bacterium]
MFTERTQVLLSPEQAARVKDIADRQGRSVGAVIRDAIDAYHAPTQRSRREAFEDLLSMREPVDDWDVMKEQILAGSLGEQWHPGWTPGPYARWEPEFESHVDAAATGASEEDVDR